MSSVLSRAERVRTLGRMAQTAMRELLGELLAFERSREWMASGARSCAQWLVDELDVDVVTAREWLRVSRKLATLPLTAAALAAGELSYSKVRALTRVASPENEESLLPIARSVSAADLLEALAKWLTKNETPEQRDRRERAATGLWVRKEADGMRVISMRTKATTAAMVMSAVDAGLMKSVAKDTSDASAEFPTIAQQRADIMVGLITNGGANVVSETITHVRGDGCSMDDGTPIADHEVARLLPESFIRLLIHDAERRPVNVSMRRRYPTVRQERFVKERDRVCVDCGAEVLLTHDHEPEYNVTKHTQVDELVLRCWPCHRKRHDSA